MTSLKGSYDVSVDVTGEDYRAMRIRSAVVAGVILPPDVLRSLDASSSPSSLFDGLDKSGLKLVATNAPLDVLVIDKMLKSPTENGQTHRLPANPIQETRVSGRRNSCDRIRILCSGRASIYLTHRR